MSRADLLEAEAKAYHAPGTCTFYGTANTNQMLMEIMGLHLPGSSFVNPNTPMRDALTRLGVKRALEITALGNHFTPIGHVIDERAVVNGVVGLHATGGSTNHTIHLVAMAAAAGIALTWDDFSDLAEVTPLLARVYPNGKADVNHFHAAGGMRAPHPRTSRRRSPARRGAHASGASGLADYAVEPTPRRRRRNLLGRSAEGLAATRPCCAERPNRSSRPEACGCSKGRSGGPSSRLRPSRRSGIRSKRRRASSTARRNCTPRSATASSTATWWRSCASRARRPIGMPELHKLMPPLGVLQDRGHRVALVTDGRLSGASGKVPSAIHVTPEAAAGGAIAKIRDGDIIRLDAPAGRLEIKVAAEEWARRTPETFDLSASHVGMGRELFGAFRREVSPADKGAALFSAA